MIHFFQTPQKTVIATEVDHTLSEQEIKELNWLYGEASLLNAEHLDGYYIGPRREMVTPWSTNAVEITQNMGIKGISRIEEYFPAASKDAEHDEMLQRMYDGLNQDIFTINIQPEPIKYFFQPNFNLWQNRLLLMVPWVNLEWPNEGFLHRIFH